MGDDVEQLDPLGAVEPVGVAEEAQPLAARQAGEARALALLVVGAAAPRSSPPRRCRRGAAPARRSPSRRARRGGRRGRSRSAERGRCGRRPRRPRDGARRTEWPLVPVGRRLEAGLGVVHPPQQRAELGEHVVSSSGKRRRAPARPRRTRAPASRARRGRGRGALPRSRPPRNGGGARRPQSVCGPTGRRTVSPTRTTTFSPTLTSPPTSGTSSSSPLPACLAVTRGRCGLPRAGAAAAPSRPPASRASSAPSSRPGRPRSRGA